MKQTVASLQLISRVFRTVQNFENECRTFSSSRPAAAGHTLCTANHAQSSHTIPVWLHLLRPAQFSSILSTRQLYLLFRFFFFKIPNFLHFFKNILKKIESSSSSTFDVFRLSSWPFSLHSNKPSHSLSSSHVVATYNAVNKRSPLKHNTRHNGHPATQGTPSCQGRRGRDAAALWRAPAPGRQGAGHLFDCAQANLPQARHCALAVPAHWLTTSAHGAPTSGALHAGGCGC